MQGRELFDELAAIALGERSGFRGADRMKAYELLAAYKLGRPTERSVILQAQASAETVGAALDLSPDVLMALAAGTHAPLATGSATPLLPESTQAQDIIDVIPEVPANSELPAVLTTGGEGAPGTSTDGAGTDRAAGGGVGGAGRAHGPEAGGDPDVQK